MFTVKSLLFSPCCLPVLEDKVNTLSQFAFCCNYKSSLLLCEGEGERASSLSDGGTVDGFVGEEWGCGGGGRARWRGDASSQTASRDQTCSGDR